MTIGGWHELEWQENRRSGTNQGNAGNTRVRARHVDLWVDHKNLGQLWIGHGSIAGDAAGLFSVTGTGHVFGSWPGCVIRCHQDSDLPFSFSPLALAACWPAGPAAEDCFADGAMQALAVRARPAARASGRPPAPGREKERRRTVAASVTPLSA